MIILKIQQTFKRFFYPIFTHFEFVTNSTGDHLIRNRTLPIEKCSEKNAKVKELSQNFNLDSYYCTDWTKDNCTFGGFWDGSYTHYFGFKMYFCNTSAFLDNSKCVDLNYGKSYFGAHNIQLQVLYPSYVFSPNEQTNPLEIVYKQYHYSFDASIQKIDQLFSKKLNSMMTLD